MIRSASPDSRATSRRAIVISVVAVLGVLVAGAATVFAVVFLPGLQRQWANTAATDALVQWQTTFEAYRTQNGSLPALPDGGYCLGTGFPQGPDGTPSCRDFGAEGNRYPAAASTDLLSALATAHELPTAAPHIVESTVGPYAVYASDHVDLITTGDGECGAPTTDVWNDGNRLHICVITLPR